jgi:hypothetical protein
VIARILGVLLGLWLLMSTFMWPHSSAQATNAVLCGIACMVFSLLGLYFGPARFVTAALGAWLALSTAFMPTPSRGGAWHNAVVGIVMFVLGMIGSGVGAGSTNRRQAYGRA